MMIDSYRRFLVKLLPVVLSIVSLDALTGCASGPTVEQLEREAEIGRAAEANTEKLVNIIVEEVWHTPLRELLDSPVYQSRTSLNALIIPGYPDAYMKHSYPDKTPSDFVYLKCNSLEELKSPRPMIIGTYRADRGLELAIGGYDIRYPGYQAKCGAKAYMPYSNSYRRLSSGFNKSFDLYHDSGYSYITPILSSERIIEMLIEKGIPLIFCRSVNSNDDIDNDNEHVECVLDVKSRNMARWKTGASSYYLPLVSFSIATKTHVPGGRGPKDPSLEALTLLGVDLTLETVAPDEMPLSLSEIFFRRFSDPAYLARVGTYFRYYDAFVTAKEKETTNRNVAAEIEHQQYMAKAKAERRKRTHQMFGEALQESIGELQKSSEEFKEPSFSSSASSYSTFNATHESDQLIPAGQPSLSELKNRARDWCAGRGGAFNSTTGRCSQGPSRENQSRSTNQINNNKALDERIAKDKQQCLAAKGIWNTAGNNCQLVQEIKHPGYAYSASGAQASADEASKNAGNTSISTSVKYGSTNNQQEGGKTDTSSIEDDCCYDVGLSDKTYGDALEKATEKANNVCSRKGTDIEPVDLYHEVIPNSGFKYKVKLTYKCGTKSYE